MAEDERWAAAEAGLLGVEGEPESVRETVWLMDIGEYRKESPDITGQRRTELPP